MGFLRSCYVTKARFFNDTATTHPIIWYWADSSAPRFAGRHTFAPLSLSGGSTADGGTVGEQLGAARPWRDGSIPMAPPSGVLDGSPSQFYLGQRTSDPGLERTDFGIPEGCAGAQPGVYCAQDVGLESNFQVQDLLGVPLGTANYLALSHLWPIDNLLGEFHGNMMCYNYGTVDDPLWALTVVTDLWSGVPGQFKPYPLDSVGPVILFQRIIDSIGPAVGRIVQV